jgi:hypothetical protein
VTVVPAAMQREAVHYAIPLMAGPPRSGETRPSGNHRRAYWMRGSSPRMREKYWADGE